jgi:hypothetical protein
MKNLARSILGLTLLSLSQCTVWRSSVLHDSSSQSVFTPSTAITKLHFPAPWLDSEQRPELTEPLPLSSIEQIEVRKVPNSPEGELLFAAMAGYADPMYSHEVNDRLPKPQYSLNAFAVNFSAGLRVRTATQQEWESGSRVRTKARSLRANGPNDSSGEIEYKQKRYTKSGQYWGQGMLSPTGQWLAVFSYSGQKRPPDLIFGGGDPLSGDIFWQVYDTVTGKKVFEWQAKNVKHPTAFDNPVIWLEDRYLLLPGGEDARDFIVVTMPAFTPEENPLTIQFPSRRDSSGQPVPAGSSNEAWTPLVPLTKEQAAKLTAPSETEISEVRLLAHDVSGELLFAIREETENRTVNRQQRDGAGDYNYRLFSTYYYALSLENPTQTRFASKAEWDLGKSVRSRRSEVVADEVKETVTGAIPPYRQFAKTGRFWGSPQRLSAGEWITVFSYNQGARAGTAEKIFVDVYDERLGDKLLSTALTVDASPNELFKNALWIENGYVLLPLNTSLEAFALWRLPGGL